MHTKPSQAWYLAIYLTCTSATRHTFWPLLQILGQVVHRFHDLAPPGIEVTAAAGDAALRKTFLGLSDGTIVMRSTVNMSKLGKTVPLATGGEIG